ncbi:hypothetical protein F2Q70_00012951 [Brassica cretica]|uniref:Methyltransferase n=1 Tax=Brassica cretica TaxID=69181 RepID=A0A8S9LYV7_BRACR|nr:hypothetical protein F2Q70_00012951 [Brassica cretica]
MESEREEVKNGGVEEDERALKRKREKEWAASSPPPLDDITDDQDNAFKVRGKNSRRIEVCRDCPYPRYSHRQFWILISRGSAPSPAFILISSVLFLCYSNREKKSLEEEKLKQEEKYMWTIVGGVKEKVIFSIALSCSQVRVPRSNFCLSFRLVISEPWRASKMVKPKNGIHPSDITMDIGKGVPVPECPFVGFGRKSAQKMTKVSSVSWTMLSTNPAGSYAMSVSLDKGEKIFGRRKTEARGEIYVDYCWRLVISEPWRASKMVKPKNGIHPSDITMDIGKGVPVPECPFVGFGRKSAQKMTKVSSVSWTMLSTNPAGSYAMSVSLDKETTKEFMEKMDLEPRQKVLNVGCGTGGGNFYMA